MLDIFFKRFFPLLRIVNLRDKLLRNKLATLCIQRREVDLRIFGKRLRFQLFQFGKNCRDNLTEKYTYSG